MRETTKGAVMLGSAGECIISAEKLAEWLYEKMGATTWEQASPKFKSQYRDMAREALDASAVEL